MKRQLKERCVNLLASIHDAGFDGLVFENIAFQTLRGIIKTGSSLPGGLKEPEEETEYCAEVLSNPDTWGVTDPAWKEFCEGVR